MGCNRSLIVCATQRSGSSYLSEALSLMNIGEPNEWLRLESLDYDKKEAGLPPDTSIRKTLELIISKRERDGIFSVKIMWDDLESLLNQLSQEEPARKNDSIDQWLKDIFPDPCIIYINRKNTLKQAISLSKARQSGIWSYTEKWKEEKAAKAELRFNFGMIRNQLNFLHPRKKKWEAFLEQTSIPTLSLDYESFTHAYTATLQRIAEFWGCPPPVLKPEKHLNKPMSDQTNQEWFEKYQALFQAARPLYTPDRGNPLAEKDQAGAILPIQTALKAHRSEMGFIPFSITNQGSVSWPNIAADNLVGSVVLDARVKALHSDQIYSKNRTFLSADLKPGASTIVELALTTPSTYGHYRIEAELAQVGYGPFRGPNRPIAEIDLEIIPTFEESRWTQLFPQAKATTWGWSYDPVYGYFNTLKYPKVLHQELGLLYCFGTDPENLWFFDKALGLLHTSPTDFPYLYSHRLQTWIEYERHSQSPRCFTRLDDGSTFHA